MVGLENVVGFEDEIDKVIGYLTKETEQLDVITIVGMPGSGKTTLASMILADERIQYEFPIRTWIDVSGELEKDVLLTILSNFTKDDLCEKSYDELANLLLSHLENEKFLIVLDDMGSPDDWDRFRIALPNSNCMGKVLITSCNEEAGLYTSTSRQPHKLRPLSERECWKLLQLKVFGETKCPLELETVGELIAKQCDGLPLAVVTMADILLKENLSCGNDLSGRKNAWIETCQSIPKYRNKNFYDILPAHLKVCFLYLATFPYDLEIAAGELIRLWIAEGFIAPDKGLTLEKCAEKYLEDLIRKNLVKPEGVKANGRVKTFRIHRMLHDFCKTEAGKGMEDLVTEVKSSDGDFDPPISELSNHRRLSIQSNISDFFSCKPLFPRTHSFFVFSKDQVCLTPALMTSIPAAFKLLRVLEAQRIQFTQLDSDMYDLIHLRYLGLSLNMSVLHARFSKFWNIQTLVVNTTFRTLDIKPDILEFTQLRHLRTNASANLCKVAKSGKGGDKLQSLATISPRKLHQRIVQ